MECFFNIEPDNLDTLDMVVISPGVPLSWILFKIHCLWSRSNRELKFYRVGEGNYIAITGTNGKTTTTTLVGEILKNPAENLCGRECRGCCYI